jgi:hypothetical protein
MIIRRITIAAICVLMTGSAFAQYSRTCQTTCYGGGNYRTCTRTCY